MKITFQKSGGSMDVELTFSKAKELILWINENNIERKEIASTDAISLESIEKLIYSIDNYEVNLSDVEICSDYSGQLYLSASAYNVEEHEKYFFNCEYFVVTREGDIADAESTNFCEYYQQYTNENTYKVYINRNETEWYSETAIENSGCLEYQGAYYHPDSWGYFDLTCPEDEPDTLYEILYLYEHGDGYYYTYPKSEIYVDSYHSDTSVKYFDYNASAKSIFNVGFEIEKEDLSVKESIYLDDFKDKTGDIWRKEKDGSLNNDSGFELISPVFPLNKSLIIDYIKNNQILLEHINADYSSSCGGHIHISIKHFTGEELFSHISCFMPLLYALYPSRAKNTYTQSKPKSLMQKSSDKYQSVKIWSNRIEIRIFPAVKNIENLAFRIDLINYILDAIKIRDIDTEYNALHYILHNNQIFKDLYKDNFELKFKRLIERFCKFAKLNEGFDDHYFNNLFN